MYPLVVGLFIYFFGESLVDANSENNVKNMLVDSL